MQKYQHSVVMTKDIRAEWEKHQSRFARQWLGQMVATKRFKAITLPAIDSEIWDLSDKNEITLALPIW
jgi:hypothetical protein